MPLTELMVKQAKPDAKPYTMADGNGLLLEVRPAGTKHWIVRYWEKGKERRKGEREALRQEVDAVLAKAKERKEG